MERTWRRSSLVLCLLLACCGGRDSGVAPLPAAPSAASGADGAGYVMASSQGLAPEGFKLAMKLDPRPGEDGIIRAGAPVTVEVDLCGSTADGNKTLHFLFDWNFNDLADVSGTGDACRQKHTYRVPADATKDVVLESNVCVTNGDPGVHDGSTYFSCRVVRVALPKPSAFGTCATGALPGCYTYNLGTSSFRWPGGLGPVDDLDYWVVDSSCSGPSQIAFDSIYVSACSDEQAAAICGGPAGNTEIPMGEPFLYICDETRGNARAGSGAPGFGR